MTVTKAAKPHFVTIFKRVKVKTEQNFSKNFYLRYLALCDPARREHGSQKWQKLHFSLCKLEAPCPPSWGQVWFCGYHPYVLVRGRKHFYVKKRFLVAQKPGTVDLFSPNPLTFREIAPFSFFFFLWYAFFFRVFQFFFAFFRTLPSQFAKTCYNGNFWCHSKKNSALESYNCDLELGTIL